MLMWVWGVLEPSRKFGGVPERPWRVQGVLLLIHGVHGFIQKGLEMSKKVPVGCRGSPGVSRASLQSSRRVWGCPRTVLECPGSVHVGLGGPGAIQKGLEMSQRGLGGSGGSLGGFCCLLEGSEDVPGVSWGVQGVLVWVWGVLEPSRRVWGWPREDLEGLGGPLVGSEGPVVFWKGLKMSQKCLGVSRGCCH